MKFGYSKTESFHYMYVILQPVMFTFAKNDNIWLITMCGKRNENARLPETPTD